MASIKAVLRKNQKSDGTYPIVIRITKDRKTSYLSLGHFTTVKDWDSKTGRFKKSHPNATRLNNLIAKRLSEAGDKLIEMQTKNTDTSSKAISKAFKAAKEGTFNKQAEIYLKQLRDRGKFNQLSADEPRINRFKEFTDGGKIIFSEIDVTLLRRFKAWLIGGRKVSERTAVNHLVVIRTVFNQAISAKLVDPKFYPFGKTGIKIKFPDSVKIGLAPEEIHKIEWAELKGKANHARNLWLFAFYFAGMRISDVMRLKWSDFQNGRLFYKMGKNEKVGSLKVPDKALKILDQYRADEKINDLVFPDLKKLKSLSDLVQVQSCIKTRVKATNIQLAKIAVELGIDKKSTTHIARHSFGNISSEKISIQMLQKLYRHSSITTTIMYQANFTHKDADDALESVLGI